MGNLLRLWHVGLARFVLPAPSRLVTAWLINYALWHSQAYTKASPPNDPDRPCWNLEPSSVSDELTDLRLYEWPYSYFRETPGADALGYSPVPQRPPAALFSMMPLGPHLSEIAIYLVVPQVTGRDPVDWLHGQSSTQFVLLLLAGIAERWPEVARAITEQLAELDLELPAADFSEPDISRPVEDGAPSRDDAEAIEYPLGPDVPNGPEAS